MGTTMAVKEGDPVKVGQKIAEIGKGPGDKPLLHFEIRVNGKPVNPARYLPRR
jgi:lipoprotein NlpD